MGCPIGCFHTVADACREHHVDLELFLPALNAAALRPPPAAEPALEGKRAR
jgi:hypothetical protein